MFRQLSLLVCLLAVVGTSAQCSSGSAKLTVSIKFDSAPQQTIVSLTNIATNSAADLPITPQTAGTVGNYEGCVPANVLHQITIQDTAGNGLSGNAYASISINDRLIASVSDYGSAISYYFNADDGTCQDGETRFVLNLKHDLFPSETQWSLVNAVSGGVIVDESSSLMTAALDGNFLFVDRCLFLGSYRFTISDSNGIDTPAFYRIFNDYTLLGVGGGDNGFTGVETTSFTIDETSLPAPTPAPTDDGVCDDNQFAQFVDDDGRSQPCIWLLDRPELIPTYCSESHPSQARLVCEETCGVCTDDCFDNDDVRFVFQGSGGRSCEWLRVRVQSNDDFWRPLACIPSEPFWDFCQETCENCGGTGGTSPTPAPVPGTAPTPTEPPVAALDTCDDDPEALIFINSTIGEQKCRWLQKNPDEVSIYCAVRDISQAFEKCPETCGACSDDCEDGTEDFIDFNGVSRPCSYIADDIPSRAPRNCAVGSSAWAACPESCGNCGS